MELDHAVVLFDEIDELVREREMEEDAFGRFLTTSMLPKLAELWDARKMLYFVATNHINYFDSAIIRSHRFDALILVSPPSFDSKVNEVRRLLAQAHALSEVRFDVTEQQVQEELESIGAAEAATPAELDGSLSRRVALAKFALLRWDELGELAYRLATAAKARAPASESIPVDTLRDALMQVNDSQWRKIKSYLDYQRDMRSERRDYQMLNVWEIQGSEDLAVPGLLSANGLKWLARGVDSPTDIDIPGIELHWKGRGVIEVQRKGAPHS